MKQDRNYINFFIGIAATIIAVSCSPERKFATEFVEKAVTKNILVIAPDYLFKSNLKTYLLDSLNVTDNENRDSLLLAHSDFLGDLNDSLFIANYLLGYTHELKKFGFNVFVQNQSAQFLLVDSNSYQVNIAQIELEENLYTFRDEDMIYDNYYYHDHDLNAVYVNSWFEVSNLDDDNYKHKVYFTSDMITDIVDGTFDYDAFTDKVRYMYNIDSLKQDVLYAFAYKLGMQYAGYTFDLLLNINIDAKISPKERSTKYWRYDPINHTFFIAGEDRFTIMDE